MRSVKTENLLWKPLTKMFVKMYCQFVYEILSRRKSNDSMSAYLPPCFGEHFALERHIHPTAIGTERESEKFTANGRIKGKGDLCKYGSPAQAHHVLQIYDCIYNIHCIFASGCMYVHPRNVLIEVFIMLKYSWIESHGIADNAHRTFKHFIVAAMSIT